MSRLFASGGQGIGPSPSASVLLMTIQGCFPLGLIGLIFLLSKGLSKSFLQHHNLNASVLWHSVFFLVQLSHPFLTMKITIALTIWTFVGKVLTLLFNTLSRFVISFLPKINHLLISWLQSPSTVILEPNKKKSVTASTFPHLYAMKRWDQMP